MSRTREKLEEVAGFIRSSYPDVKVETVIMDLASQESIRRAAAEVARLVSGLDILVNNAGVTCRLRQFTAEGVELQFGVNHIGTFLLTKLLFPLLKKKAVADSPRGGGATRIVNVSSHGHRLSPVRFHDYNMLNDKEIPVEERPMSPLPPVFAKAQPDGYLSTVAYAQSKTANILFTLYLQDHAKESGIMSYALHPGGTYISIPIRHYNPPPPIFCSY